jgi:cytochrome b561
MSSASGFPVVYFGLLPLPDLVDKNKELAETLKVVHFVLNKTLLAFVALHVAAALKHHLVDHDNTLRRMWSWRA